MLLKGSVLLPAWFTTLDVVAGKCNSLCHLFPSPVVSELVCLLLSFSVRLLGALALLRVINQFVVFVLP